MSSWLIAAVGVVYAGIAVDFAIKGNLWLALVFGGYSISNAGLYMMALKG